MVNGRGYVMDSFDFSTVAGLALGGTFLFLPAWAWARRRRRAALRAGTAQVQVPVAAAAVAEPDPRAEARLAALEETQADLVERIAVLADEAGRPEERLKAISGQLLTVIRERNAGFDEVVAGLETLRKRVATLEGTGDQSAVRQLLDALAERIDGLESDGFKAASAEIPQSQVVALSERQVADLTAGMAEDMAAVQGRLEALETPDHSAFTEISERLTQLYAEKDAALEALMARFEPLEARLDLFEQDGLRVETGSEDRADSEATAQVTARLAELQQSQAEVLADLAALREGGSGAQDVSARLEELQAQRDALTQNTLERLSKLENDLAARDPQAAFDGFAERLESLREAHASGANRLEGRVAALEASDESPFVEISEQLTRLYAQKDTTVETVFSRLGPLEAKLTQVERDLAARDPKADLERLDARLTTLQGVQTGSTADLEARLDRLGAALGQTDGALEALRAETGSVADLEARLGQLQQQRDALAQSTAARLSELERDMVARDPREVLDGFSKRLEALREAHATGAAALEGRVVALETPGVSPFAEISAQLTNLYAQKDATVETVFARLAPLESKLVEVERDLAGIGAKTGARLDGLTGRVDALDWAQDEVAERITTLQTGIVAVERGLAAQDPQPTLDGFDERLGLLQAQRDALIESTQERMSALERQVEAQDPKMALDRFAQRLEAMRAGNLAGAAALDSRISVLENPTESPFAEISEQLTKLYAQKDATVETVFARLAPLEAKLAEMEHEVLARDPQALLDRFAERLEAMRENHADGSAALEKRLTLLEAPGESPFAEISDQLTRLYAQKDATVETVFARLAPLEAKLAEVEHELSARDPKAALDRFAERLAVLETPGESPFSEISDQLTRLYAQKDATVETVFARLAPLEAKLAEMEQTFTARDPQTMLDRFAERLEVMREIHADGSAALEKRLTQLETPGESPFSEISQQLTKLYAQKDATVETVFARLAPLEAKLAEMEHEVSARDPKAALEQFGTRLERLSEGVQHTDGALEALRAEAGAAVEISTRLEALQESRDALAAGTAERLSDLERDVVARDPQAALDAFAERLEALRETHAAGAASLEGRLTALESPGESPFAAISQQLTKLYAQRDETAETVLSRLAPLEAKLAEVEKGLLGVGSDTRARLEGLGTRIEAFDVVADRVETLGGLEKRVTALDGLAERIDALGGAQGELSQRLAALQGEIGAVAGPFAELSQDLNRLYAQKDESLEVMIARLAPIEDRLAGLEEHPWDPAADEARAQAQAIASQMIAARAAAEHTELFADRLALLEASLPRLSAHQTELMTALEHGILEARAGASASARPAVPQVTARTQDVAGTARADDMTEVWSMPQLVSLHRK